MCPSRIRLVCLEIHLDQSLGTRIILSDGKTGSDTDHSKDRNHIQRVIFKNQISIHHTRINILEIKLHNKFIDEKDLAEYTETKIKLKTVESYGN